MSELEEFERKKSSLSKRLLSTFELSDELLSKLSSNGFTMKSEIEDLNDSELQTICGLDDNQIDVINKVIKSSHKTSFESKSALELSKSLNPRITTGCKSMDRALNGGLEVSKITQICGEGGVGKTQICMQLCINVQIPQQFGGLSGHALYIDTENSIRPERLVSMAEHCLSKYKDLPKSLSVESIKSHIHLKTCNTNAKHFVDLIINRIEPFIDQNPQIRLVVIDSIAQLFRYDYKGSDEEKEYELSQIAHKLKLLAHCKKVAILIANQVSYNTKEDCDVPSLGKQWQTVCSTNIMIKRSLNTRYGILLKSMDFPITQRFYFNITENGIQEVMPQI